MSRVIGARTESPAALHFTRSMLKTKALTRKGWQAIDRCSLSLAPGTPISACRRSGVSRRTDDPGWDRTDVTPVLLIPRNNGRLAHNLRLVESRTLDTSIMLATGSRRNLRREGAVVFANNYRESFEECAAFAAGIPSSGTLKVTYDLSDGGWIELRTAGTPQTGPVTSCSIPRLMRRDVGHATQKPSLVRLLRRFANAVVDGLPPTAGIELGLRIPPDVVAKKAEEATQANTIWPALMQAVLVAANRSGRRCDVCRTTEMDIFIKAQFLTDRE
jgi:hypothetical protein